MKKYIYSAYLKVKHILKSVKECNQIHLMDNVIYDGKKCFVNNGTKCSDDGTRLWDIVEERWNSDGTRNTYCVPSSKFKRCFTYLNIKNSLLHHYRWWKMYWYDVDLRKLLNNEK